ncbi:hypothetical protein HYU16_03105 [Candidatus Woesearchaeota archaeon]|nr:hypothetical protein [Candidatus Woesearchaeota archaeon]
MDFSKYDKRKLLLLLIFSLLVVQTVAAQNLADMLGNIPAFEGLSAERVEELYDDFWWLWDAIIYTIILGVGLRFGAAQSKVFGEKGGMVGTVIALVLAFAAVFAENQFGFNLKKFAPLALAIALFAIAYFLWNTIKGMNLGKGSRIVFALLFLGMYGLTSDFLKGLREMTGSYLTWIPSIMDILAAVFVIMLLIELWNLVSGAWKSGGGGGGGGFFGRRVNEGNEGETRRDVQVSEQEAQQIANVELYEKKLDQFAKRLGKKEIGDERQFEQDIGNAITLAGEAENAEAKAEEIMQGVQAGRYGKDAMNGVESLRKKYKDAVEKMFNRVRAAVAFARAQRQAMIAEWNETLAAAKADMRVRGLVANLSKIVGTDKDRFLNNHNLTGQGQVKQDVEALFKAIGEFQLLENEKRQVFGPQEQQALRALIAETNKEIMDLNDLLTRMEALKKTGNLRKEELYQIKQHLTALLEMSKVKQHGIQRAQDILNRVRNVDNKIRQVAVVYQRLLPQLQRLVLTPRTPAKNAANQQLMRTFRI